MKRLIIANTYYQILFAIQLRQTIFLDDEVTLLISDHSVGTQNIAERIRDMNLFFETHYINTLGSHDNRNIIEKIQDFCDISFRKSNRYSFFVDQLKDKYFDEIDTYNYSIQTYGLYSILCQYNKNILVSRYEEGALSYNTLPIYTKRRDVINHVRRLIGKPDINSALSSFYCFYPEVYHGSLNCVRVPLFESNEELKSITQQLFELDTRKLEYKQKYIYFSSVYDFEGGDSIKEFETVLRIRELVGNDNLLVKVHPRDVRSIYTIQGFNVDTCSNIPWEVIQLNGNYSDKVLITANSTCVISSSLITKGGIKGYYVFKCCDLSGNISAQKTTESILNILNTSEIKKLATKIKIAERLEDILK